MNRHFIWLPVLTAFFWLGSCTFDTSGLGKINNDNVNNVNNAQCGNGTLETGETCDGTELGGATCLSQGFETGTLACATDCLSLDTSGCQDNPPVCGNGTLETGETCDGTELGGATCLSRGFESGTLACAGDCLAFDTADCQGTAPVCGNDQIEGTETCDGTDLFGETCQSQGFLSGTLACLGDCTGLDTSACSNCGNAQIESGEACDGDNLGGASCTDFGF
ncbi:hypothetical protein KJ975_13115, partial [Myxococcota bacterium]|nr:hypothetical protein [Myxococcota bacterium]